MSEIKNKRAKILLSLYLAPVCAALYFCSNALFRDAWFDESLTVLNFMLKPSAWAIYNSYVIPNNQILYTIVLKYWVTINSMLGPTATYVFRMPSFFSALGVLALICFCWRKRIGTPAAIITGIALGCSIPFMIYGTAIRGYMLSLLLLGGAMEFAFVLRRDGRWPSALGYLLCSFMAVLTIPSNIIALGAIFLLVISEARKIKLISLRTIFLASVPIITLLVAYLPIWRNARKILALREGWSGSSDVIASVYLAVIFSLLPLLVMAMIGFSKRLTSGRFDYLKWGCRLMIVALPLPFIFARDPAPFPRVFFTMWCVWLYLLSLGTADFLVLLKKRFKLPVKKLYGMGAVIAFLIFGWGLFQRVEALEISEKVLKIQQTDDYFSPYYMRKSFKPLKTIKEIRKQCQGNMIPVYISFDADPWSIIFYARMQGMDVRQFGFDNPMFKIDVLPPVALAILHDSDDIQQLRERYNVKSIELLSDQGFQKIYLVKSEPTQWTQ